MPTEIVKLDEVKAHLPGADSTHDASLQGFIDAASDLVEGITGPVRSVTYTGEVHDGGWPTIALFHPPIVSVTTIQEYIGTTVHTLTSQPPGSTVDNYGYSLDDPASGIIVRRSAAGTPIPFFGGPRSIVVTYAAGQATVPNDVRLATLELVRLLWTKSQGMGSSEYPVSLSDIDMAFVQNLLRTRANPPLVV